MHSYFRNLLDRKDMTFFTAVGDKALSKTYAEYFNDISDCLENIKSCCSDIKGKHIGILADNSYEYLVVFGALFMGEAFVVPINAYESADNIEYIISNSDTEILIVSERLNMHHADITLDILDVTKKRADSGFDYEKCIEGCSEKSEMLIYTSGTTGRPKGVQLVLSNFLNMVEGNFSGNASFAEGINKMYITVPMYHVMGFYYWLMSLRADCSLSINSNVGEIVDELKEIEPDLIIATPAFVNFLKKGLKKESNWADALNFVICGGAVLNKELVEDLKKKRIACLNVYGMTETGGSGTFNFDIAGHIDSIGLPSAGTDLRIIDGEICIACASMMKGYYKNEEATKEVLIDGYMHTGDLGYIAEDGYTYITGRKKNLIILSGGENVSPEEIEKMIYKNPNVKECIVVGKDDRLRVEVYADKEFHDDITDFVREMNKELPIFKRIYGVDFRDSEFEKTANGKIKR
ncbi:MAG: acyl--CoA ligase [Butyrivibrio sp.]|nr:acyl--CoA ligase [Butyrivibrio sp.]